MMKRGAWHQCGDKSQKFVQDQLDHENGKGVIMSPRDLSRDLAAKYAVSYREREADILLDPQFYVPDFTNDNLKSYQLTSFRDEISKLNSISDPNLDLLARELQADNRELQTAAIIAPAVVYEAARPDILKLNSRLFKASKNVGDVIGVPTYASVFLGRSLTSSDVAMDTLLSSATSLNADGWYFGFEFDEDRIPVSMNSVLRYLRAGIILACTGRPVMSAYAGPLALLSFSSGISAVGIGHFQNLWNFTRERWQEGEGGGGGGDAPSRYFSRSLWGTIIYLDETALLPQKIWQSVYQASPFTTEVEGGLAWSRWTSYKHLVYTIGMEAQILSAYSTPRDSAAHAVDRLRGAITLHEEIARLPLFLKDSTSSYQANWLAALEQFLHDNNDDLNYLSLLQNS